MSIIVIGTVGTGDMMDKIMSDYVSPAGPVVARVESSYITGFLGNIEHFIIFKYVQITYIKKGRVRSVMYEVVTDSDSYSIFSGFITSGCLVTSQSYSCRPRIFYESVIMKIIILN